MPKSTTCRMPTNYAQRKRKVRKTLYFCSFILQYYCSIVYCSPLMHPPLHAQLRGFSVAGFIFTYVQRYFFWPSYGASYAPIAPYESATAHTVRAFLSRCAHWRRNLKLRAARLTSLSLSLSLFLSISIESSHQPFLYTWSVGGAS